MNNTLLSMKGIRKTFSGVAVLDEVELKLNKGECLGLLGSNGAGKSTLIKILSGIYSKDKGNIFISNNEVSIKNSSDSIKSGVGLLPQELSIHSEMTVAENLMLGNLPTKKIAGIKFTNQKRMNQIAREKLLDLGLDINVQKQIKELTLPEQRIVEIARAMVGNAKILIMDEPTAALTSKESKTLFEALEKTRKAGVGIIYISHYLDEVFEVCQRIVVLRDGKNAGEFQTTSSNHDEVLSAMLGNAVENLYPNKSKKQKMEIALKLENVTFSKNLYDLNFEVYKGEILGVFGLLGSGLEDLGRKIYGISGKTEKGKISLFGKDYKPVNPQNAKKNGIGFIPAERKTEGILSELTLRNNMTIPFLNNFIPKTFIDTKKEKEFTNKWISDFDIKCLNSEQLFRFLSGGNQQKACIARWLVDEVSVLIIEEPTRGVDLGARKEIYQKLRFLCDEGLTVIIFSSDVEEIHGLADRFMVLNRGTIKSIFDQSVQVEQLMAAAGENINSTLN